MESANTFGIDLKIEKVDFAKVMKRMRTLIDGEIDSIRQGLTGSENIDYYHLPAEFVRPYTLKVGRENITSKMFLLCTGSKPIIPPISGLEQTGYQTSDTILHQTQLPESVAVIGGGYIAAAIRSLPISHGLKGFDYRPQPSIPTTGGTGSLEP